jgi:hypothetical protein
MAPYQSLLVLAVRLAIIEPLKVLALLVVGDGHFVAGTSVMICAYAGSLFITERLFRVLKPKLLSLAWFAKMWSWFVTVRDTTRAPMLTTALQCKTRAAKVGDELTTRQFNSGTRGDASGGRDRHNDRFRQIYEEEGAQGALLFGVNVRATLSIQRDCLRDISQRPECNLSPLTRL